MLMMANSAPWDGQWILLAPGIVILVGDSGLELVQPNGGGCFYYPDNYSTSSLKQPQEFSQLPDLIHRLQLGPGMSQLGPHNQLVPENLIRAPCGFSRKGKISELRALEN